MTKSDQDRPRSGGSHWLKHVITLLLLLAVIVAGVAAFQSRQQWSDLYVKYLKSSQ